MFLDRYLKVEADRLPARFKITKHIPVYFKPDASLEELWMVHDMGMENYRKTLNEVDLKETFPELPEADTSLLDLKVAIANRILESCHMCERRCGPNRKMGKMGSCRLTNVSRYTSEFLNMEELPELVPSHTVFFAGCIFSCVYCESWEIATCPQKGVVIEPKELARIIDRRRGEGSKNINFVPPIPHLYAFLRTVNELEANIPVIWNSNMYYSWEAGKLLEGVVDVYIAEFKYGNDQCAKKYSNVKDFMQVVKRDFEMAYKDAEIILRHVVMPEHLECCTQPIAEWAAEYIPGVAFDLKFHYAPYYLASEYPEIDRRLTSDEMELAVQIVKDAGIENILV